MTMPGTRSRRATVILLLTVLVLGFVVAAQHRRETRLRQALVLFRKRGYQSIHERLDSPPWLSLNWGATVRLGEVIGQINRTIPRFAGMGFSGVSFEVDPAGLKEAGQSLTSLVQIPGLPGADVTLHDLLCRILEPMDLSYEIKDGTLSITSRKAVERSHERILKLLEQPIFLTWPDGARVEDVIQQVSLRTLGPDFPLGLPAYLDPKNLEDSDRRRIVATPSPEEALPIWEHLARLLQPLRMTWELRNGALMILPMQKSDEPGEANGSRAE